MGMFDSLMVPCPKCGAMVEFQSKAGECILAEYTIEDCPIVILADLMGEKEKCACGQGVELAETIVWIKGP